MKVSKGETVGIIGQNGAGKTTLCKILAGLIKPYSGSVELSGQDIEAYKTNELYKKIGFVFQEPDYQFVKFIVGEDLELSFRNYFGSETLLQCRKILKNLDLVKFERASVYQLSMGQRRKLSIATMLTPDREILILDEPMTGLDEKSSSQILEMVRELKNLGMSLIIISHDIRIITGIADRVIGINNGEKKYDGPINKLFSNIQVSELLSLSPPAEWLVKVRIHKEWGYKLSPEISILDQLQVRDQNLR